ncbi:MAG: hypothetical protein HY815_29295 [Candidatus Riflebacteria bacterium]|nr:hypothetical protein [Candidatus Riflebacteria bacterium]
MTVQLQGHSGSVPTGPRRIPRGIHLSELLAQASSGRGVDLTSVVLARGGQRFACDLVQAVCLDERGHDPVLADGDWITVRATRSRGEPPGVYVCGSASRQGRQPLVPGQRVDEMLRQVGVATGPGGHWVHLVRGVGDRPRIFRISTGSTPRKGAGARGGPPRMLLEPDDLIVVSRPGRPFVEGVEKLALLLGAVSPGEPVVLAVNGDR